jgi:serine/threonine protein kinase
MAEDRRGPSKLALFGEESDLEFRGEIGSGSMGTVYRAFHRKRNCEVAVKTIRNRTPKQVSELKAEFRVLGEIVHPNLVQLYELVEKPDACYFTMEFVEGTDFVKYVGGVATGDSPDAMLDRFHQAAPQLVRGLAALHTANRCHRDVKPSNVLVGRDGCVKILDFGLALAIGEVGAARETPGEQTGTPDYMAPEQFWGMKTSFPADWYAVGVVFYEALTGRSPLKGMNARQGQAFREELEPQRLVSSLPGQRGELVAALLDPEPSKRPKPDETLERLARAQHKPAPVRPIPTGHRHFVGRTRELEDLRQILRDRDRLRVVEVHGESGIGKTELVRRFLQEVEKEVEPWVLVGRCHPQESVPFKALDAIMDRLSQYLLECPESELDELRPDDAAALARLFPTLEWLPKLDPLDLRAGIDPMELLRRGIGAHRDLLRRIAERRPLVLWIDDAQWSDSDSARLIRELLRPPSAPPLMLILSYRSQDRDQVDLLRTVSRLADETPAFFPQRFALEPLPAAESLELAERLFQPDPSARSQVERFAAESGGSPYLLTGMARHLSALVASGAAGTIEDLRLQDVISIRLSELPEAERHLLELVAVSNRPTRRALALDAAGLGERGLPLVQRLDHAKLLLTSSIDERGYVESYHDRIREAVIARLSPAEVSERHNELATALEKGRKPDDEVLAHHLHGAGNLSKAATRAERAARSAVEALAFARGAELFRKALDWGSWDGEEEGNLLADEADALAKAGRLIEAGTRFREAAEKAHHIKALERRQQAAQHLVSGGHVDLGIEVFSALLEDLGLRYPRTPRRALRAAFALLGEALARSFDPRGPGKILDEMERIRIDTCYGCGHHLVDSDSSRGIYFSVVSLVKALRVRDQKRTALGLCVVGGSLSALGGWPLHQIGERMMRRSEAIAAQLKSPEVWGTIDISRGQALMLTGHCEKAWTSCDDGVKLLTEKCQGHALECDVGRMCALRALEELGRMDLVAARGQELRDAAAAVGDRYAETAASQILAIARIACDDVASARELAEQSLKLWTRRDFHIQHFYAVRVQVLCDLYEGRPSAGWKRLEQVEPALRRSELLRIALTRTDLLSLRGQLALASASQESKERDRHLRACYRAARELRRQKRADASLHSHLLLGGMAALRDDEAQARANLEIAIELGDNNSMRLRAACARLRKAELLDNDAVAESVLKKMVGYGVHRPERWAAIYAPGFAESAQD